MILKGKKCIATRCLQAVETEANGALETINGQFLIFNLNPPKKIVV